MIKITDYNVSKYILKKVNKIIHEILCFYNDLRETDDKGYLQMIFPRHMVRENINLCYKTLELLEEYMIDEYYHDLNETQARVLLYLLNWYIESTDDDEGFNVNIDNKEILTEDDEYIAKNINFIEAYKDFMFYDWDFDDDSLANYLEIYFKVPELVTDFFHVDLDEYLELMPEDKRKEYLRKKGKKFNLEIDTDEVERTIIKEIFSAIKKREEDPLRLQNTSETQLSTDISDIIGSRLKKENIIVEREKPNGFALKTVGEDDFYIYSIANEIYKPIAIGENKEWGTYDEQIKQLLGYMNQNCLFGFTIIFNKNTSLDTVLNKRRKIIEQVSVSENNSFKVVGEIQRINELNNVLVSTHTNPEDNSRFRIYHFIINCYYPERKASAKEGRAKRK